MALSEYFRSQDLVNLEPNLKNIMFYKTSIFVLKNSDKNFSYGKRGEHEYNLIIGGGGMPSLLIIQLYWNRSVTTIMGQEVCFALAQYLR